MFKRRLLDILIICANLIGVKCTLCASCDINADPLVERNTYLSGSKFWDHQVDHIGSCARICMRMTMCKSFNFDLLSRGCELNREVLENHPEGRGRNRNKVYSKISAWPRKLDPDCYSHSCNLDEVCVPGAVVNFTGSPSRCLKAFGKRTCPEGWMLYQSSCYYFSSETTTWYDASTWCESKNSSLVQIESANENNFLSTTARNLHTIAIITEPETPLPFYWTNGNDIETENNWVWGHPSGIDWTFKNWETSEPNGNRNENCLALYGNADFLWVDAPCEWPGAFICEKLEL